MTDSRASSNIQISREHTQPEQMADAYADRLMHELFDGVERALAGDAEALDGLAKTKAVETPTLSETTLKFTEGGMPAVLMEASTEAGELAPIPAVLTPTSESEPHPEATPTTHGWRRFWTLNRALLGAAGLCVLATIGLWLYQRRQMTEVASSPMPLPTDAAAVNPDAEFLQYLQRSLDVIAQNVPETATATTSASDVAIALNGTGTVNLPPVGTSALPPTPSGIPSTPGSINVIERVYVPYPSAQMPTNGSPAPNVPVTQGSPPPTVGTIASGTGAVSAAAVTPHTLLGVLELGDSSAALFEIDGVPQRVYIGERIGNSGWSLVSVANEEAVIRRNGEVRSLYIGQQF